MNNLACLSDSGKDPIKKEKLVMAREKAYCIIYKMRDMTLWEAGAVEAGAVTCQGHLAGCDLHHQALCVLRGTQQALAMPIHGCRPGSNFHHSLLQPGCLRGTIKRNRLHQSGHRLDMNG